MSTVDSSDSDLQLRYAAMTHCNRLLLEHSGTVPSGAVQAGFDFGNQHIYLMSTPRGIHKPTQMRRGALSIKTTIPKHGRKARYADTQVREGFFSYAFQGNDPSSHDNQLLLQNFEDKSPLLYFSAVAVGIYQILFPSYIIGWNPSTLSCSVAIGAQSELFFPTPSLAAAPDRRYSTVEAKVRLHQARFRVMVLEAYGERCAVSNLPIRNLLDAAHIIPDADEDGRPEVTNGLCLSKLHHTAYDCNLLGIDADGLVHIPDRVMDAKDGPTLEAIKAMHGRSIRVPRDSRQRPSRDLLARRFELFQQAS